jgi:hypothetical protein
LLELAINLLTFVALQPHYTRVLAEAANGGVVAIAVTEEDSETSRRKDRCLHIYRGREKYQRLRRYGNRLSTMRLAPGYH